jgi:hypothetical protein
MGILIVIAAVLAVLSFLLYRSANKSEEKFANRPFVITNPAKDLFSHQKYAIVGLFATIQGASPITACHDDINKMVQSTIFSLGLSKADVEHYLSVSMKRDSEREFSRIIDSLKEIRDKRYIHELYEKCMKIARMTGDKDTLVVMHQLANELGIPKQQVEHPRTIKNNKQQPQLKDFYDDRKYNEIARMHEDFNSYNEGLLYNDTFRIEILNNPQRSHYYVNFIMDSIIESIDPNRTMDLSDRILKSRQKYFELESNKNTYQRYILDRLQSLDKYIEIKIDERYKFLEQNYSSSLKKFIQEHGNYGKFLIVKHENEIKKLHKVLTTTEMH